MNVINILFYVSRMSIFFFSVSYYSLFIPRLPIGSLHHLLKLIKTSSFKKYFRGLIQYFQVNFVFQTSMVCYVCIIIIRR